MAKFEFFLDHAAVNLFRSWHGPVGHSFGRLERETVWRAQQRAGKRTGALRASITARRSTISGGNLRTLVGSWTITYTAVHELGSKPHKIAAKNAPYLVFFWPKVGRVVHFKSVNHPGTKPTHFLSAGMERAVRMWERGG